MARKPTLACTRRCARTAARRGCPDTPRSSARICAHPHDPHDTVKKPTTVARQPLRPRRSAHAHRAVFFFCQSAGARWLPPGVGGARVAPRLGAPRIRAPALAATYPVGTPIALNRGSALPTSARCCQARWSHARTCASALVRVLLPRPAAVGHAASPARRRVHPTQCAEGLAPARFSRTGHTALEDGKICRHKATGESSRTCEVE